MKDIRLNLEQNKTFMRFIKGVNLPIKYIRQQKEMEKELKKGKIIVFSDKSETSGNGIIYQDIIKLEEDGRLRLLLAIGQDILIENTNKYIIQVKPFKGIYSKSSLKQTMDMIGLFFNNYNYCFSVPSENVDILFDDFKNGIPFVGDTFKNK
jgi:hypothetical protein